MIRVETTYRSASDPLEFRTADEYTVDPTGALILSTGRCQQVGIVAPGRWLTATVIPNRGPDGRFAKRGSR